jgi:hypothetical protein
MRGRNASGRQCDVELAERGLDSVLTEEEYRAEHPGVLRLYDIRLDDFRDVTQADVDQMMRRLTDLLAPKITPREGEPPAFPNRVFVGTIEDAGRRATVGILLGKRA